MDTVIKYSCDERALLLTLACLLQKRIMKRCLERNQKRRMITKERTITMQYMKWVRKVSTFRLDRHSYWELRVS